MVQATVANHKIPHKGDEQLFWYGELESVCKPCHDGHIQSSERRQERGLPERVVIGLDGWPLGWDGIGQDRPQRWGFSIPHYVKPSAVPVHLVCGPPGAGKTTYVRQNSKPGDIIIDFDLIRESLGMTRENSKYRDIRRVLRRRDTIIRGLHEASGCEAWIVMLAPTRAERREWKRALGGVTVHKINTEADECKRRIALDKTREGIGVRESLYKAVDRYFLKQAMD